MSHNGDISTGELGRQIRQALDRIEVLTNTLSALYVNKETFKETQKLNDVIHDDLRRDIDSLLDDKKALVRLVMGVIIVAVLGVVIVSNGGGK